MHISVWAIMMGDNDSTDLKVTNSQKQEQRAHNRICGGKAQTHREDTHTRERERKIISDDAYEIPGSNLVIHT